MFRNYLKIAWRNLLRNKLFSLINILGLSIGITCTLLIALWVQDEMIFDKGHKNYDDIYQVVANRKFNNDVFTDYNMCFPLAYALNEGYPEIRRAVVLTDLGASVFSIGEKKIKFDGLTVNGHFFDVFSFSFLKGNAGALREQGSVVITASMAKALFGEEDPLNKTLKVDNNRQVKVGAVVADPPANSSFSFDYLEPFSSGFIKDAMSEWVNSFTYVYLQTNPGADLKSLDNKINVLLKKHVPDDVVSTYFTFPMSKWHLQSDFKDGINVGGLIDYVKMFSIIAVIILSIACVNFMNLSTARSEGKSREVGVRKTLGSTRKQLFAQFICESMLITFFAFLLSLALVYLLLPSFNLMVNKHLSLPVSETWFWISSLVMVVVTGFVSGTYPALYLSSFNPTTVLKGVVLPGKKAMVPRRILVTGQFIISILFISATIIVFQQIQYLKNRAKGYDSENLVVIPTSEDLRRNFELVKQEVLTSGLAEGICRTSSPITEVYWFSPAPDWQGKSKSGDLIVTGLTADAGLTKTLRLKLIEGSDFSGLPSDSNNMLLNRTAVKAMGLDHPVGMRMRYEKKEFTVIGVVDDVIMESPYKPVKPLMIYYDKSPHYINVRLSSAHPISESLKKLESICSKHNPAYPFEYQFVSEDYSKKFIAEELIGKLTNIFAGLAIFICCLGVVGLTLFTIEKRTKELGIRKVLGASLSNLVLLISDEFVKLVLLALVVTVPLAWVLMNWWLENYEFRIQIAAWPFAVVGLCIISITFLIVFVNTLIAGNKNPVKSLRSE